MLGLALSGTYTLIREGTNPALKVGGRRVVPKTRFHNWLDGSTRTTPTPIIRQHSSASAEVDSNGVRLQGAGRRTPGLLARGIRPAAVEDVQDEA
jgi:hypothetical protein